MRKTHLIAVTMAAVMLIGAGVALSRATRVGELDAVRPGVLAQRLIAELGQGHEICQRPLYLDQPVRRIGLAIDDHEVPGPLLDITIRDLDRRRELTRLSIPEGWSLRRGQYYGLRLPASLPSNRRVEVCIRNRRGPAVGLVGSEAIMGSDSFDGRRRIKGDWAIYFPLLPKERRTWLALVPTIIHRATVLRPGIISAPVYGVLAALLFLGGPLVLWRAVTRASDDPED